MLLPAGASVKIHIAAGVTDMRKGMDGLAMLAERVLKEDPFSGHLFAFRGRKANLIKIDLPPFRWSKIYVILDTEGKDKCHSRNTRRRRLSASCVRQRLCWHREERQRMPVVGYRSASRPITVGAKSMAG